MNYQILQAFTMWVDGVDYGANTEEVQLPLLTPVMQEYRGGGMDLAVSLPLEALEALEATVKIADQDTAILKMVANGKRRVTFRGAVRNEATGRVEAHVCVIEGNFVPGSRDAWRRGEKAGIELRLAGITYLRYDAGDVVVHEVSAYPPKRIVDGVDLLISINQALGI